MGKGDGRRVEDPKKFDRGWGQVDWSQPVEPPPPRKEKTCGCPVGWACEECLPPEMAG